MQKKLREKKQALIDVPGGLVQLCTTEVPAHSLNILRAHLLNRLGHKLLLFLLDVVLQILKGEGKENKSNAELDNLSVVQLIIHLTDIISAVHCALRIRVQGSRRVTGLSGGYAAPPRSTQLAALRYKGVIYFPQIQLYTR